MGRTFGRGGGRRRSISRGKEVGYVSLLFANGLFSACFFGSTAGCGWCLISMERKFDFHFHQGTAIVKKEEGRILVSYY
jgi:hypothetical protein